MTLHDVQGGESFRVLCQVLSAFQNDLVDVTPPPVLSRLKGHHDGMLGGVKVLGGMLVLRFVAAADMATNHANAQVDPRIPHRQAFLAAVAAGGDLSNLVKMCTPF
jgi:hypothetical protein